MKTHNANRFTIMMLLLIFPMAGSMTGCQAFKSGNQVDQSLAQKLPQKIANLGKDKTSNTVLAGSSMPKRMVIIWKDAVVRAGNGQTKKGFGGRVYFYGNDEEPVQVDGQMTVYGYDDTTEHSPTAPERKYVFERDKFQKHYDPTELGPSYSLWIPWDEVQAPEKTISLMPFFETAQGQQLSGGMSEIILPGKKSTVGTIEKTTAPAVSPETRATTFTRPSHNDSRVVLASGLEPIDGSPTYSDSGQPQPDAMTKRRVDTIDLPKSLETRILNSPAKSFHTIQKPNEDVKLRRAMKQLVDDRFEELKDQQAVSNQNHSNSSPTESTRRPAPAGTMRSSQSPRVFGSPAPFQRAASQPSPIQ